MLFSIKTRYLQLMKRFFLPALALMLACATGLAQLPDLTGGGAPGTDFALLSKLLGKLPAFTARSTVRVLDKNQVETISVPMDLAMLGRKIRMTIDATKIKNKNLPPGAIDALKQTGLDQVVMLIRPDRQSLHFIYPALEAYLTLPMEKKDLDSAEKSTVKTEALGKETLDGHACVKNKVTITTAQGDAQELTVWNATDLQDFPIQTLAKQDGDTVVTRYTEVKFTKSDTKQFDPPARFEEYKGLTSFMAGMTKKLLTSGLPTTK